MSTIKCITVTVVHSCGHNRIYTIPFIFVNQIATEKGANMCPMCWDKHYYSKGIVRYDKLFA